MHIPLQCVDLRGMAALTPPVWLLMPRPAVSDFAQLRPDLELRIAVDGLTEAQITAARLNKK
jgi:hypothetical protein